MIQVSKYPSIQVSKYPSIQVSKYPSIQVSKYPSIQVSKYPSIQVSIKIFPLKNQGFSLTSTLIAVFITGITFIAMISMLTTQQKEGKAIYQQLARGSLKYTILQVLKNPDNCTCQLNLLPSTPHTIDTTKTTAGSKGFEIDLGEFRSGCSNTTDDNILVKQGEKIPGGAGMSAEKILISKIVETGTPNEFIGDLTIKYRPDGLVRTLNSLTIPLILTVDPSHSTLEDKPILQCGAHTDVSDRIAKLDLRLTELITNLENRVKVLETASPPQSPSLDQSSKEKPRCKKEPVCDYQQSFSGHCSYKK